MTLSQKKIIPFLLLLSPLWWILGLSWIVYHLVSFIILLSMFYRREEWIIPKPILYLLVYIFIYFISLAFAWVIGADKVRIIASTYNATYWIMGFAVALGSYRSFDHTMLGEVQKSAKAVIGFSLVTLIVFWGARGNGVVLEYPSMISPVLSLFTNISSLPILIQDSAVLKIFGKDWLELTGVSSRFSVLSPYSTALAGTMILMASIVMARIERQSRLSILFFVASAFLVVIETHSRSGVIAFIVMLIGTGVFSVGRGRVGVIGLITIMIGCVMLAIFFLDDIQKGINYILTFRANSTNTRFMIYKKSIEVVFDENPIIGVAIKPRGEFSIPLGSHSTIIGVFFKTGFMGLLFYTLFILSLGLQYIKNLFIINKQSVSLYFGVVAILAISVVEDLDAPQLLFYSFFIVIGMTLAIIRDGILLENSP